MIRSTLSFCALFGALILGSKLLQESSQPKAAAPKSLQGQHLQNQSHQDAVQKASESNVPTVGSQQPAHSESAEVSRLATDVIQYVSYEEDRKIKVRDPDDNDVPPRPSRELEDLLKDEPAAELHAADNPMQSESDAPRSKTKGSATGPAAESTADQSTEESVEKELTPELIELRDRLRQCLAYYYFRPENVATRSPWGSMHWMIAYGVDSQLIVGPKRVNAIGYLNYNGVCNGQRLFYTSSGKIQAQVGVGVQGHAGQYLAMLAQSRVKTDYPMQVDGQKFTVADLIEHEKLTCRPASELTFKLIALSHYLKSDEKWTANDGQA